VADADDVYRVQATTPEGLGAYTYQLTDSVACDIFDHAPDDDKVGMDHLSSSADFVGTRDTTIAQVSRNVNPEYFEAMQMEFINGRPAREEGEVVLIESTAMALFGTTSPSYLILASLDNTNVYLTDGYKERLASFILKIDELKKKLSFSGYSLLGDEKLKLTIKPKEYGYLGSELYSILYKKGIVCEFYDKDFLVMMLSLEGGEKSLTALLDALLSIPKKSAILDTPPRFLACEQAMSTRMAHFSASEEIDVDLALDRVMAGLCVSCPPAVSVISSGEIFNQSTIELLKYYGVTKCKVVKK
jgi:arginine/lysine/ornithine decarboxylase